MLKLRVVELARMRGIRKIVAWLQKQGLSRSVAENLAAGKEKGVKYTHLLTLSDIFGCDMNDLFIYIPKNAEDIQKRPYLKTCLHNDEMNDLANKMENLSQKKIRSVMKYLKSLEE